MTNRTRYAAISLSMALIASVLDAGCSSRDEQPEPARHEAKANPEAGDGHDHGDEPAHDETESHEHEDHAHADEKVEHSDESEHDEHAHESEHASGAHEEEGLVRLTPEAVKASGIEVETSGPRVIRVLIDLPGEIAPNADRLAHVVPRFPGIAKEVKKNLGDRAQKGEVLAIIESNESLALYEVSSLIAGTIIEKHITLGEFVRDDADVFIVADLSTIWVNITVYSRDLNRIQVGQRVEVTAVGDGPSGSGSIDYIGAALGEATRAASARVVLNNPKFAWRPGMFVSARVVVDETPVNVAVPESAAQTVEGKDVIFLAEDESFELREVTLGRSDGEWTEILSGMRAGDRYVSRGAFILKSELMKSEASHEH